MRRFLLLACAAAGCGPGPHTSGLDGATQMAVLTVARSGPGSGVIISSPTGIDCGQTCSLSLAAGSVVALAATANQASTFTGWSGGGCSGTATCTVELDRTTLVTA